MLVDTSKSLSPATLAVFEHSDLVFVVTSADLPSIRNIQRGLPLIRRALVGGEQQIRVIVNRYQGGEAITIKDIERTLGLKVYATLSNDYEAVITSVNSGKPLILQAATSKYVKDLRALGDPDLGPRAPSGRRLRLANPFRALWHRSNHSNGKGAPADE